MRTYHQLTPEERYALSALRRNGFSQAEIARVLGRHPSTINRELKRNARKDGGYRPGNAQFMANGRRSRSRRNWQFTDEHWAIVLDCLEQLWSPEQIAGRLALLGVLSISHETIYRYIWLDRWYGGTLYRYLRQHGGKLMRKRYGRYDSRGRLAGKRAISERPPGAENRSRTGHLEGDTVIGSGNQHCILTLVDRKTGHLRIGKLKQRSVHEATRAAIHLIRTGPRKTRTLTLDNGTEFHGYKQIEKATGAKVYFATPHHSWERGTSENTNGLIRQYLPKRVSMARVSQRDCNRIATSLNNRPRKRLGFLTPAEVHEKNKSHS